MLNSDPAPSTGLESFQAMRLARSLANDLSTVRLAVYPGKPIVGELGPDPVGCDSTDGQAMCSSEHEFEPFTPDFPLLLRYGNNVLMDAFATWSEFDPDNAYYQAAQVSLAAFQDLIGRLAADCGSRAAAAADELTRADLDLAAANLQAIRQEPPKTFPQALQLFWLTCLMRRLEVGCRVIDVGRLDQYFLPYYRRDILQNDLNRGQARDWLSTLLQKMNENSDQKLAGSQTERPVHPGADPDGSADATAGYCLMLGGAHNDGSDATNELTYHCLELATTQDMDHLAIRVWLHDQAPSAFVRRVKILERQGRGHLTLVSSDR